MKTLIKNLQKASWVHSAIQSFKANVWNNFCRSLRSIYGPSVPCPIGAMIKLVSISTESMKYVFNHPSSLRLYFINNPIHHRPLLCHLLIQSDQFKRDLWAPNSPKNLNQLWKNQRRRNPSPTCLVVHRIPLLSFTITTNITLLCQDPKYSSERPMNLAYYMTAMVRTSILSETNFNNWIFATKRRSSSHHGNATTNSGPALSSSSKRPSMFSFSWTTKRTSKKRCVCLSIT